MQLPATTIAFLKKFCHLDKLSLTTQHSLGYIIYKPGISLLRIYRARYSNNVETAIFPLEMLKVHLLTFIPYSIPVTFQL